MEKFDDVGIIGLDDMPKDIMQQINSRCAAIMLATLVEGNKQVKANIALGGLQKACSTILANFFHEKDIERATDALCNGIRDNIKVWKFPDLQRAYFDEES